jgi:type II protein arginine methyltransferase
MKSQLDALTRKFREGHHAQALAECEALCAQHPDDLAPKRLCARMHALAGNFSRALALFLQIRNPEEEDAENLFNIALCERELKNFESAARYFALYTQAFPQHADGWAGLAESQFELQQFTQSLAAADRALQRDSTSLPGWTARGKSQKALGRREDALTSFQRANAIQPEVDNLHAEAAIQLELGNPVEALKTIDLAIARAPQRGRLRAVRGDALQSMGQLPQAADDYKLALALGAHDDETIKKATVCMLEVGRGQEALALCRDILQQHPDHVTAKTGAEWLLSRMVPPWHVPMMNETARNQAYFDGLRALVAPDKSVFEIGTGSGLLAMMAGRLGAKHVVTCEAVSLIADTAKKIVERNGLQSRVTVLDKPSMDVAIGSDLAEPADILVHEIFSSELLGEHVLPAIEDAKKRLLRPGGQVLPASASIMIALVGGDDVGKYLWVDRAFDFDLTAFNAIHPKKRPLYREDLAPVLLSGDTVAFAFDFVGTAEFPPESKVLELIAQADGTCYGVIQWLRIDVAPGVRFENHPSVPRTVSNWQHTVYGFDAPVLLKKGDCVRVAAWHDRARPWFERTA